MVEELKSYSHQDVVDLDLLMHELSATSYCNEAILNKVLKDVNTHVFVIREEGHIVATASLYVIHTLEFTIAGVESVVVSSCCRGKGYGKDLMNCMIHTAKEMKAHHIHLTSNPNRAAANAMYARLGFERYDTNCYRMKFGYIEEA